MKQSGHLVELWKATELERFHECFKLIIIAETIQHLEEKGAFLLTRCILGELYKAEALAEHLQTDSNVPSRVSN